MSGVAERVARLTPGRALVVGATGTDATVLAERGWTVTVVDPAQDSLDRARDHAGATSRFTWVCADPATWLTAQRFDLVTSTSVTPRPDRWLYALAALVAPRGSLVVGADAGEGELAALLGPGDWTVETAPPDGPGAHGPAVLHARRRGAVLH